MSLNFGGSERRDRSSGTGTSTTNIQLPEPDPQEARLREINLRLAQIQAGEYLRSLEEDEAFRQSPLFATQRAIEEKASANILARLTGEAPVLSPEEQARLDEIYGNTQREGEESLRRYAEEIAGARGLAVSDSPIGNEALRQHQEFIQNLGAQKAGSAFDLGNAATNFASEQQKFAAQLRQAAYMNRLSFASQQPSSFGFQGGLFGERLAGAPRSFSGSQSGTGSSTGFQWGAGVSGQDVAGYAGAGRTAGFF